MKQFKKRTLALVLASVVTVVGSFASENYKNSLMALNFEAQPNGAVNMILETKVPYSGNIVPTRKDANTYVLMLPEVNSNAPTPDLKNSQSNIESVAIRTMPYSQSGKGYTRITIKTITPLTLLSSNKVFLPTEQTSDKNYSTQEKKIQNTNIETNVNNTHHVDEFADLKRKNYTNNENRYKPEKQKTESNVTNSINTEIIEEEKYSKNNNYKTEKNSNETLTLLLSILLVFTCIIFFYIKAKNKLTEIAGERLEIDVDDVDIEKKPTNKGLKKIKDTVKTLDSTYSKTAVGSTYNAKRIPSIEKTKPTEIVNVVDLDKLYEEQNKHNPEIDADENQALEDFLNGFSFYEEDEINNIEEEILNEEAYQSIINNKTLKFNKIDLDCINELLNSEINAETLKNINQYLVSNPIIKKNSKTEILEKLITDYTISQNIIFNSDDINIIKNLMSVELDSDFINNLKTNPIRTKEMEQEIENEKSPKPTEIITLSVKESLPDLTKELKKNKGKTIESNYKPETVYFQEGYEVSTLSINENLPDLSKEIHNKKAYASKPSAEIELVDSSYEVSTLKVADSLKNFKNNAKPKKESVKIDEKSLLNSIQNVEFKPFYDGQEYEILNDIPSVDDIKNEMQSFKNFEITENEENINIQTKQNKDLTLTKENEKEIFIDLDKKQTTIDNSSRKEHIAKELLQKISETKAKKELEQKPVINKSTLINKPTPKEILDTNTKQFIVENESFSIVSSTAFFENIGCHLAKNENGYAVLAFNGDKVSKIKTYTELKSQKIQSRLSETLTDGTLRYLIRIGNSKFVIDIKDNNVKYVMDLC